MKRFVAVLAGLLLAAGFASQAFAAADTLAQVKKKGVLTVGVRDAVPPFGFMDRDKGQIVGAEIDLANAVAKRLGVKAKFLPVTAAGRLEALLDGKVDLVAATFSKTPDRAKIVDFSLTYFQARQRVLAKKGAVSSLKDLDGKKVAVVKGTTSASRLREKAPAAVAVPVENLQAAVDALQRGDADAVTGDGVPLFAYLQRLPKDAFDIPVDVTLGDEPYGMAVRKGDAKLLQAVNDALTDVRKSGEGQKIMAKWFRKKEEVEKAAAPPPQPLFAGAVTRATSTAGRYVVVPLKGAFREGADVSFYSLDGTEVCKGKVHSVYGDEVYVDATGDRAGDVAPGFPVGPAIPPADAKKLIASRKDVFESVKADSKKEADQRQKEIAADYKKDQEARVKYQEEMTKKKMELDYQYSDETYYYSGPAWNTGYPYGW